MCLSQERSPFDSANDALRLLASCRWPRATGDVPTRMYEAYQVPRPTPDVSAVVALCARAAGSVASTIMTRAQVACQLLNAWSSRLIFTPADQNSIVHFSIAQSFNQGTPCFPGQIAIDPTCRHASCEGHSSLPRPLPSLCKAALAPVVMECFCTYFAT